MTTTNEYGYKTALAGEAWVVRLDRIHAMQRANGLTPARTRLAGNKPCGRCGDTDRFVDHGDSVCATCGLTRFAK